MLRALSASDLLNLMEQGAGLAPAGQALLMLRTSLPHTPPEELAALPLGRRDALLIQLRQRTLGDRIEGLAACPACGERVEMDFSLQDLLDTCPGITPNAPDFCRLEAEDCQVTFRLPNSTDLADLHTAPNLPAARMRLLQNCLIEASRDGRPVQPGDLPEQVIAALSIQLEQADPLASANIPLACPACAAEWQMLFDISSFFWSEITAWAQRLMREVHCLAAAYGWREADILSMSAWRRRKYLDLIGI